MSRVPQVVALGGGGFSMEAGNALLDDYLLAVTGVERPKLCFLPTTSGDVVVDGVRAGEEAEACRESGAAHAHRDPTLEPAHRPGAEPREHDAGVPPLPEDRVDAVCARPQRPEVDHRAAADIGEPVRRPAYLAAVAARALPPGYGVDDGAGLLFRGTRLAEVVSASAGAARAYRVTAADGVAREHQLEPRRLERPGREVPGAMPHDIGELRLLRAAQRGYAHD